MVDENMGDGETGGRGKGGIRTFPRAVHQYMRQGGQENVEKDNYPALNYVMADGNVGDGGTDGKGGGKEWEGGDEWKGSFT